MNQSVSVWKIAYGLAFGAIISVAYLFVKLRGSDGGLDLFCLASVAIFIGHLIIWPKLTLAGIMDWKMMIRGLLYGLTQVLIFKSQAHGSTSTALIAATTGNVFGAILGRLILKEKLYGVALLAATICASAAFTNPNILIVSYWGLIGGFIQGLGFVLARSIMIEKKSIRQSISTGFFFAAAISVAVLLLDQKGMTFLFNVRWNNVAFTVAIAVLVQYGFFYLFKILDSQRASLLALSRIPSAIGIESVLFGRLISVSQGVSAVLILIGHPGR